MAAENVPEFSAWHQWQSWAGAFFARALTNPILRRRCCISAVDAWRWRAPGVFSFCGGGGSNGMIRKPRAEISAALGTAARSAAVLTLTTGLSLALCAMFVIDPVYFAGAIGMGARC
jgi:hypothetical protein